MVRRSLRIALVQTRAETAGAQEISRLIARGLEERGHDVRQIVFFRRTASTHGIKNARFIGRDPPSSPWGVLKFLLRLRAELREARPDAVLSLHDEGQVIVGPIARSLGCRVVVAGRISTSAGVNRLPRWVDALIGSLGVYSRIVVSSNAAETIYRRYWHPYSRRILRIDPGFEDKTIALAPSKARAALGLPQGVTLLGCASRLNPSKQIDCALRLLAIRPTLHLALAGQGAEKPRLASLAATLGLADRVHFVGALNPSEIGVFLAGLDLFLHPSRVNAFGLAPVEAARAGVPVVCNDLDVLREVLSVEGQPCAIFADAQDPESLAGAVDRILTEPGLADTLRRNGQGLSERYPIDAMVDDYARLLDDLVWTTPRASPSRSIGLPYCDGTRLPVTD